MKHVYTTHMHKSTKAPIHKTYILKDSSVKFGILFLDKDLILLTITINCISLKKSLISYFKFKTPCLLF